jgi:NAD-dependent SIR2 family protein deacetylase
MDDLIISFEKPYIPQRRRSCPYCGEPYLEPGIIPPIFGKAGEARHIEYAWKEARNALKRANEIVIIGYSLPEADLEAFSLIREITTVDPKPKVTIVCGPDGAPTSYNKVLSEYSDSKQYFEDFAIAQLSKRAN